MNKSAGQVKIVKVPASKRPSVASLKKLDHEIAAQVSANEAMSNRSMLYASKTPLKQEQYRLVSAIGYYDDQTDEGNKGRNAVAVGLI